MIKVCSSQYSYFFGNNQIHFPYSIATNISYASQFQDIKDNFNFEKVFIVRDNISNDIELCKDANILLCSCYCWNWEITQFLIEQVKRINPNCLIICGGPEVPHVHDNIFEKYPGMDILVHDEGELTTYELLSKYLKQESLNDILGTENKNRKNLARERIKDLDIIPSPYSSNLILNLVNTNSNIKYIASWETNRGCPYACKFCDWGSATKTKVRNFSEDKLYKEIEWFGANNIPYIDVCDGNFGIFVDRDYQLAHKLSEVKQKTGYPEKLNITWAKVSSEKIIPIAQKLNEQNLVRAISLSVQSLDKNVLKTISRSNIKFTDFESLVNQFDNHGLDSYTELIMGLPGETIQTYKNTWATLASIYPAPSILTWNCSVFNNAPMNDKSYKDEHGIETFKSPVFMQHSVSQYNEIPEYERMVRKTKTLPNDDIIQIYLYDWVMLTFHAYGILEFIGRYFHSIGITYTIFYDYLVEYCKNTNGIFAQEYQKALVHANKGYNGGGWDHYDTNLGDISWPMSEASWLRLVHSELLTEIQQFIQYLHTKIMFDQKIIDDLIKFQLLLINLPDNESKTKIQCNYDWLEFFTKKDKLQHKTTMYSKMRQINSTGIQWNYETIWYGRRAQKYKTKLRDINVES
jgi:radical SAM superfamily enzyme YgiQ (UPF0313 family)